MQRRQHCQRIPDRDNEPAIRPQAKRRLKLLRRIEICDGSISSDAAVGASPEKALEIFALDFPSEIAVRQTAQIMLSEEMRLLDCRKTDRRMVLQQTRQGRRAAARCANNEDEPVELVDAYHGACITISCHSLKQLSHVF